MKGLTFKGEQFGVRLEPRGEGDNHVVFQLLTEDDGNWSEVGTESSSFWIDDLIGVLTEAKMAMRSKEFEREQWGYNFKVSKKRKIA